MRHAPLIVGTLGVAVLVAMIAIESPGPGELAAPHAHVPELMGLDGCARCHADDGLQSGCLHCHVEIAGQLSAKEGLHKDKPACVSCHPEHHGEGFDLMGPVAWKQDDFRHEHVEFELSGKHDELACQQCHTKEFAMPGFAERKRTRSFIGLDQTCTPCHANEHEGVEFGQCQTCHDETAFKPAALFDHSKHFPLVGGHETAACKGCHVSFDKVKGTTCQQCHATPHRTEWGASCEQCHAATDPTWKTDVSLATHEKTSFSLSAPHNEVACEKCHKPSEPYEQRFAPHAQGDCRACHEDVHKGQFKGSCLDCHFDTRFKPHHFTLAEHAEAYPLDGAHEKAACAACHKEGRFVGTPKQCAACHEDVHKGQFQRSCLACHTNTSFKPHHFTRVEHAKVHALRAAHDKAACAACHKDGRFVGTPKQCAACHEDVHKGQFEQACSACHLERAFRPSTYRLKDHKQFPITGSHDAVSCRACHKDGRFADTPRSCKVCHGDPHGGQFAAELKRGECTSCHRADAATFRVKPFDHSKYPLEGAHAKANCNACHAKEKGVRRYRGIPKDCASCHTDVHRGQFKRAGRTNCKGCHDANDTWQIDRFDHNRKSRFKLDGTHAKVACSACHRSVPQPDRSLVVQYKPLKAECKDCHDTRR